MRQSDIIDFNFFTYLRIFYTENRGRIRTHFRHLSKKFLDFNDPKSGAYLWEPQYEALEMYVFLKEYLNNRHVHEIFTDWYEKQEGFENRTNLGVDQVALFGDSMDTAEYERVFNYIRQSGIRTYPNYIFSLPMGTGKTYLMATCIFYEFLLANKFPKDPKYCHNALVFAPDTTVLQSLKKIKTLDLKHVVPPEYLNFLSSHIRFHFLDQAGTTLSTMDRSMFNVIISNAQKIILKRQHKEKSASDRLFKSGTPTHKPGSVYEKAAELYDFDTPEDDDDLTTNQRFQKLTRLEQLGIFVDEAHHAFGSTLAGHMGVESERTMLRITIDELAAILKQKDTHVCACYNFTGTPYVKQNVLPEVVYSYGLREAIDKAFLKKVHPHDYTNTKSSEFVKLVVKHFWETHQGQRHEGMLPKLAFFATTIEELQNELRPALEDALSEHGIPTSRILVNVGDTKVTDDIRRFDNLDTTKSEDQFILLVNKGKEGWDCRSLFGVALYREPKSKIFVLQAGMRCLRKIGEGQQTGHIYLSKENEKILNDELEKNFRVGLDEISQVGADKQNYEIRVNQPPVKVTLQRIRKTYKLVEKQAKDSICLELDQIDTDQYRIIHTEREGLSSTSSTVLQEDMTEYNVGRDFSSLTLCAEIARYLNRSPLEIEGILTNTQEGMEEIIKNVREFNEILYDWIIPRLFEELYDLEKSEVHEPEEIELVKEPKDGYYKVRANPDLVTKENEPLLTNYAQKSFHLDTYAFDSQPEKSLFWNLLMEGKVKEVYFTGMLTHGQSDFYIQYIDPESYTVRRYYPDFLMQKDDGSFVIVEVKGDNKIDDKVVQAKAEATKQTASASDMSYKIIKGSYAKEGRYQSLLK